MPTRGGRFHPTHDDAMPLRAGTASIEPAGGGTERRGGGPPRESLAAARVNRERPRAIAGPVRSSRLAPDAKLFRALAPRQAAPAEAAGSGPLALARDLPARYEALRPRIAKDLFEHAEPYLEAGNWVGLHGPDSPPLRLAAPEDVGHTSRPRPW